MSTTEGFYAVLPEGEPAPVEEVPADEQAAADVQAAAEGDERAESNADPLAA